MALAVEEPVDRLGAVPAGDDDRGGAGGVDRLGELLPVRLLRVRDAGDTRLVQVRRHHRREWEQSLDEHRDGVVAEELRTGGGDHHRVDDEQDRWTEEVGDRLDDRRAEEHPRLRGVDADVVEEHLELLSDDLRRRLVDGAHLGRGLRGQRDDRRHAVTAEARERLQSAWMRRRRRSPTWRS